MLSLLKKYEFYMLLLSMFAVIKITKENINGGIGGFLIINAMLVGCWGISLGFSGARSKYAGS